MPTARWWRGVLPLGSDSFSAPIFIVGCGRSGTTLLELIVNRHPELAIFGETGVFFRDRKYGFLSNPGSFQRFLRDWSIAAVHHSPYPGLMESPSLKDALLAADTYVATISLVMEEFARAEQKPVWGEKTPAHVMRLAKIFAAYPKARVIHITRDPRAVVASATIHLGSGRFVRAGVYNLARYWTRCEEEIEKFSAKFSRQILLVRYENLVTQPEAVVRRLCAFLGVAYASDMIETPRDAERYAPKVAADGEVMAHHRGLLRDINAEAVDKWRESLSPEMITLVEVATMPWFTRRGYGPASAEARKGRASAVGLIAFAARIASEARRIVYRTAQTSFWYLRANVCG